MMHQGALVIVLTLTESRKVISNLRMDGTKEVKIVRIVCHCLKFPTTIYMEEVTTWPMSKVNFQSFVSGSNIAYLAL